MSLPYLLVGYLTGDPFDIHSCCCQYFEWISTTVKSYCNTGWSLYMMVQKDFEGDVVFSILIDREKIGQSKSTTQHLLGWLLWPSQGPSCSPLNQKCPLIAQLFNFKFLCLRLFLHRWIFTYMFFCNRINEKISIDYVNNFNFV